MFVPGEIPIEPILRHYGWSGLWAQDIRGTGKRWARICCPFHPDSNPSGAVNFHSNRFHCWAGCTDKAEDAVGLVKHVEGISFRDALAKAKGIAGVGDSSVPAKRRSGASLFDEAWD